MRNLKKFLALVLATLMIVSAMVMTSAADAKANHDEAVSFLNLIDVYLGNGESMAADELVTRWQMALFVSRVTTGFTNDSAWAGTENTTPFTDVEAKHYLGAIACAYNAGIINGRGDNKFDPEANISYQEALAMAVRALGYKGLAYPGETVQMAQKLGLTDNLNELDNKLEANVTRGQIAEILKNTLYATAKDSTTLLESVFKMTVVKEAVVVATPKQALVDGVFAPDGYVRLAAGDDAKTTYLVKADLLLAEGEKVEELLGYSFTVATTNNFETIVNAIRCDAKVVKNYFTNDGINSSSGKIKLEGTDYSLANIDVYTLGGTGATIETKGYYYNLTGDIVDDQGTVLLYNIKGEYWKDKNAGTSLDIALVKATAADFEAALSIIPTVASNTTYSQVTSGNNFASKFAEAKLFDDNGDGKWDRAIYTPYSIGKVTTTANVQNTINAATGNSNGSTKKTTMSIAVVSGAGSTLVLGNADGTAFDSATINYVGGKPANNDYVVYHYNKFTATLTVVENLGAIKTGAVSEVSGRGSYVVIGGKEYKYNFAADSIPGYGATPNITPAIDALVDKTYNVKYVAFGDYVLVINSIAPTNHGAEFTNYVVFSWADVKGVDADGNLIVNAIVDATGEAKEIKINAINNYKVGLKLADVIEKAGQSAINPEDKYIVGSTSSTTSSTVDFAYYIRTTADVSSRMGTNIYAGKVNADGTYTLVTFNYSGIDPEEDIEITKATAANGNNENIAGTTDTDGKVFFQYGINKETLVTAAVSGGVATKGKFDTTSKTVYLFVGSDKYVVYKGVAPDGASIDLNTTWDHDNNASTPEIPVTKTVYNATSSFIFVTTTGKLESLIDETDWVDNSGSIAPATKSFYTITDVTYAALREGSTTDEEVTLVITSAYDVLGGKYRDLVLRGSRTVLKALFDKIDGGKFATVFMVDGDQVVIDTDYLNVTAALYNAGYTTKGDLSDNSGDKTGYSLSVNEAGVDKVYEHLQSIKLTVVFNKTSGALVTMNGTEGYKFTGEDFAFYKVDTNGNLTGFVFAPNYNGAV